MHHRIAYGLVEVHILASKQHLLLKSVFHMIANDCGVRLNAIVKMSMNIISLRSRR